MKILKGVITTLAGEGRMSLQVPQYTVIVHNERAIAYDASQVKPDDVIDAPDEWFVYLRNNSPAVGKESGHLFLTRAGWDANRKEIREAFLNSEFPRGTWADFQDHVDMHFAEVKRNGNRRIKLLNDKVKQLKEALKKI